MNELILGVPRSQVRLASHDPRWLDCYTAADTVTGRVFFSNGPESGRTHHLSVCEVGSDFWVRQTAFRDALRADSFLRQQYAALKQQLAQRYPRDRVAYTAAKEPFIQSVMTQAR